MDISRLNRKIFNWAERQGNGRCQNWNYKVNQMLQEAGIQYQHGVTNRRILKAKVSDHLFHKFLNSWTDDINRENARQGVGRNKLRTYRTYKNVYITEQYLNCIMPYYYRSAYAKFRCGVAPIRLETGRYERLPEELRTCFNCPNSIENEEHVLLKCPLYSGLRVLMFNTLLNEFPGIYSKDEHEQLSAILSCKQYSSIRSAKTCYEILRTRQNNLYK